MEISINQYIGSPIEKGFVNSFEKAEGDRGGKVIGHTKSGKPIYQGSVVKYDNKKYIAHSGDMDVKLVYLSHIDNPKLIHSNENGSSLKVHQSRLDLENEHENRQSEIEQKKQSKLIQIGGESFKYSKNADGEQKFDNGKGTVYHSKPFESVEDFKKRAKETIESDFAHEKKKIDLQKSESTKDLVKEHKRLVDVLESPSHEDDKKEAKIQKKELKEYEEKSKPNKIEKGMETVSINQYKGSQIEKGFVTKDFNESSVIVKIGDAFNKGLIDEETLEKAVSEANLLTGTAEVGTHLTLDNGSVISKSAEGWQLEKAKSEEVEEKEEEETTEEEEKEGKEGEEGEEKEEKEESTEEEEEEQA